LSDSGADVVKADTAEVTNAEWNEVTEWALANGYDLLPIVPGSADGDKPVTGINYWQAIKWCNARSEKEGLEPAYYLDISEVIGDLNGDGQITNGADTFEAYSVEFGGHDSNNNGKWDDGEPFLDNNGNDIFEPVEWVDINDSLAIWEAFGPFDFNANGLKDDGEPDDPGLDHGLTQVFRTGATIPGYGAPVAYTAGPAAGQHIPAIISDRNHTKLTAQGYRLPTQQIQAMLAIAGNHKKLWPWGDTSISQAASQFSESGIVSARDGFWPDGPLSAASRGSNAFGLKDILGNVAEWSEGAWNGGESGVQASVFGGSYQGLDRAGTQNPDNGQIEGSFALNDLPTENLFAANISGPADDSTPAIGLRCVRYK
jgi:hypothetical protein